MGTRVLLERLPITRAPPDEPLSPGLRNKDRVEAIGFHVDEIAGRCEDEDNE